MKTVVSVLIFARVPPTKGVLEMTRGLALRYRNGGELPMPLEKVLLYAGTVDTADPGRGGGYGSLSDVIEYWADVGICLSVWGVSHGVRVADRIGQVTIAVPQNSIGVGVEMVIGDMFAPGDLVYVDYFFPRKSHE